MKAVLPTWRAAALMVRVRAKRMVNRWGVRLRRRDKSAQKRSGTASKGGGTSAWTMLLGAVFVLYAVSMTMKLDASVVHAYPGRPGEGSPFEVLSFLAVEIGLIQLVAFLSNLANKEISAPEWDFEWLATLPVSLRALIVIRGGRHPAAQVCRALGVSRSNVLQRRARHTLQERRLERCPLVGIQHSRSFDDREP